MRGHVKHTCGQKPPKMGGRVGMGMGDEWFVFLHADISHDLLMLI